MSERIQQEDGIEIPLERISPEIAQQLIEEFVTREWGDPGDDGFTLEDKVAQVRRQLQAGTATVVYDFTQQSWNIVETKKLAPGSTGSE